MGAVKTFGPVDERSLEQLKRCMAAGDADYGVLCADHHPGYSQPIGGGIAYEGYVSPSGVGYDIGCVAAGARVTTADGYSLSIERVAAQAPVACVDDGTVRRVEPNLGAVPRGRRGTVELVLDNGRRLRVTRDHRVQTRRGWVEARYLWDDDEVLVVPFVGLPYEPCDVDPARLRVLGYAAGAGRASVDAHSIHEAPAWARAHFLSALASAAMAPPRTVAGGVGNLALKHADAGAARLAGELLESLGFRWSLAPSRGEWVVQVIGGDAEKLRFLEEVGFCRAAEKRRAGAVAASVAWQRLALVAARAAARRDLGALRAAGATQSTAVAEAASRNRVTPDVDHQAVVLEPRTHGEACWVRIRDIPGAGEAEVWDVTTADPAESFLAEGVVVHNCGNKAARTDLTRADLDALGGVERVMGEITRRVSFGMGRAAQERVDHPVLEKIRSAEFRPQRKLHQLAESQLGTVGSGNHYVNLMEDEEGKVWVGVHFGSRGFGHRTASGFLALAQGLPFDGRAREGEMDSPPVLFPVDSELGQSYVAAMQLAGEYAYAGRDVVVRKVLELLGAEATHEVHNHHNFAWREEHHGRTYWVIRKGCTPARPGQEGFVGGSMGDDSVILEGVAGPEAQESLFSTVHGAGRVMSRSQAAGRVRRRKRWACRSRDCPRVFETSRARCPDHPGAGVSKVWVEEQLRRGLVDWPAVQRRLRAQGIVLVGGGADEAPEVYKRLPDVLAAHGETIRVKHTLSPLGVAMAGRDVYDPYKD